MRPAAWVAGNRKRMQVRECLQMNRFNDDREDRYDGRGGADFNNRYDMPGDEDWEESYADDYDNYVREEGRGRRGKKWIPHVILLAMILVVCGLIVSEVLDLQAESSASSLLASIISSDSESDETEGDGDSESVVTSDSEEAGSITAEEEEEEIDLSDIDEILAENELIIMFDGTIFDASWYQEALAATGSTDLDGVETTDEIYRHYQLYGQGDGLTAYDTSAMDEETQKKLAAYEELLQEELDAENGTGWTTVTADICDTEEIEVWNIESLVAGAEDSTVATTSAAAEGDSESTDSDSGDSTAEESGDSVSAGSALFSDEAAAVLSEAAISALSTAIAQFEDAGYDIGFVLLDLNSGAAVSYRAGVEVYSASVIKAPYIFSLLEAEIEPTNDMYLAGNQSDNDAYVSIRTTYGNDVFAEWIDGTGIPAVQSKTRYITTTPLDLARMFYKGRNLLLGDETYSDWARNTFTDSLNSAAALTIGETKSVYSKAGWISASDGYSVSSYTNAAIVDDGENPYVVTMMSNTPGWTGLIYAQDLMPVLDLIHDELCGLEVDYSTLDIVAESESEDSSGDDSSAAEGSSSGGSSGMIDEDRKWSDGAPDPDAEGGPNWSGESGDTAGGAGGDAGGGDVGGGDAGGGGADVSAGGDANAGSDVSGSGEPSAGGDAGGQDSAGGDPSGAVGDSAGGDPSGPGA